MASQKNLYKTGEHFDDETGEIWCDEVETVAECDYCGDPIHEGDDMTVFIRPGKLGRVHVCAECARENKVRLGGDFLEWLFDELGVFAYTGEAREAEGVAMNREIELKRQAESVERTRQEIFESFRNALLKGSQGARV